MGDSGRIGGMSEETFVGKVDRLETRLDRLDGRFDRLEDRLLRLADRVEELADKVNIVTGGGGKPSSPGDK